MGNLDRKVSSNLVLIILAVKDKIEQEWSAFLCIDFPLHLWAGEKDGEREWGRKRETIVTFSIAALQANKVGVGRFFMLSF